MSFVELKESALHAARAKRYLEDKAKADHLEATPALYKTTESSKMYFVSELDVVYDEWYSAQLRTEIFSQYRDFESVGRKIVKKNKGCAYDELQGLIGLREAKRVIDKAIAFYKAQKVFKACGIPQSDISMHMVFTGNPGTAKTTVARLLGLILYENDVMPTGHVIEVGRADLVGKYVGWTAQIVKKKFEQARGGILFIDEAYSLLDDKNGLYGDEAINTIVQEMENERNNTVVILAGYPDRMESFLQRNPGLRSRIAFHVPCADYDTNELCDIAALIAKKDGLALSEQAQEKLSAIFEAARRTPEFGNGRFARNIVESARMEQAARLISMDCDSVTETEIKTLYAEDFAAPMNAGEPGRRRIGF